ncbi:MAG: hypothetical protein AAFY36_09260 [Bacteroidota bacterium]
MPKSVKLLLAFILCTLVLTQERVCEHLGFGRAVAHQVPSGDDELQNLSVTELPQVDISTTNSPSHSVRDHFSNGVTEEDSNHFKAQLISDTSTDLLPQQATELDWRFLVDIEYELKYFEELDMEVYVPIFDEVHQALDGQEVVIEGYVIPFDLDGNFLSLSYNPYASCFFCGKASPASVMSLYVRDEDKRYQVDDFKKFRGTLHLNYDDPNEFYYILRDAREE